MKAKLIILLFGLLILPLGKLVGFLAERSWGQTWALSAGIVFVLAIIMFKRFRDGIGPVMESLSKMGGHK